MPATFTFFRVFDYLEFLYTKPFTINTLLELNSEDGIERFAQMDINMLIWFICSNPDILQKASSSRDS